MAKPLPCLVCGKALETCFPGDKIGQPSDAVMCLTRGNYGSTVYDPPLVRDEYLAFNVCDECLLAAGASGRVEFVVNIPHPPDQERSSWTRPNYD